MNSFWTFVKVFVLSLLLLLENGLASPHDAHHKLLSRESSTDVEAPSVSEELSSSELSQLVTVLEDPKKREEFLHNLRLLAKTQVVRKPSHYLAGEGGLLSLVIAPMQNGAFTIHQWAQKTFADLEHLPRELGSIREKASHPGGWADFVWFIFGLGLALTVGFLVEFFVRVTVSHLRTNSEKVLHRALDLILFEWMPSGVFALAASFVAGFIFPSESQGFVSLSACILATFLARLLSQLLTQVTLLSRNYSLFNRGIILVALGLFFFLHGLVQLGLSETGYQVLLKLYGLLVLILLIGCVWAFRREVSDAILPKEGKLPLLLEVGDRFTTWFIEVWFVWVAAILTLFYVAWAGDEIQTLVAKSAVVVATLAIVVFIMASPRWLATLELAIQDKSPPIQHGMIGLTFLIQLGLFIGLVAGILDLLNLNLLNLLALPTIGPYVTGGITIGVIITLSCIGWISFNSLVHAQLNPRSSEDHPLKPTVFVQTIFPILQSIVHWIIVILAAILILQELGFPVLPILYGVSVLGLAISLGCQNLVKDIINGFLTLMEGVISVGEVIKIGEDRGVVETITLRGLTLRHSNGALQTIPFSEVTSITNLSRDYSIVPLEFSVSFKTDIGQVSAILEKTYKEIRKDKTFGPMILEPLQVRGIKKFTTNAVQVSARIKILPDPSNLFLQEFNRRLKSHMDELHLKSA